MGTLRALFVAAVSLPALAWAATQVSVNNPSVLEGHRGTTPLPFSITRSGDSGSQLFLYYRTEDGTAKAPSDYVSVPAGELHLRGGTTSAAVNVLINGDLEPEPDETLTLRVSNAVATGPFLTLGNFGRFSTGNELLDLKPWSLAVGDINLDGRIDVAVANSGSNDVGILRNTSGMGGATPSFANMVSVSAGFGPRDVALADVNGDGRPDLIVANSGQVDAATSSITVHINTTSPGSATLDFSSPVSFLAGQCGNQVRVADFNADGRLDIAAACGASARILLNTMAPGASSASFVAAGITGLGEYYVHAIAVSDLNSDGRPDLVLLNSGGFVYLFLNTTDPGAATVSFSPVTTLPVSRGATTVSAGDLNGDGRPDLVVARGQLQGDTIPSRVEVLLNLTSPGALTPSFSPFVPFNVGPTIFLNASLADVNGDGRLDIVAAMSDNVSFETLLNATAPGATVPDFRPGGSVFTGGWMTAHATGDLNNDGRADFALLEYGEAERNLYVLLNATPLAADPPDFLPAAGFAVGAQPRAVAVADFNLDGRPDLAAANAGDGTVSVLAGAIARGAVVASFGSAARLAVGTQPEALLAADLNNDGKPDLVVANAGGDSVSVIMNTGAPGATPAFGTAVTVAAGSAPRSLAAGDFNDDGKPDLAVANSGGNTVSVLFNGTAPGSANAAFSGAGGFAVGTAPRAVAAADFNLDGRLDIAAANSGSNSVTVLLSSTSPGAGSASFAGGSAFVMGAKPVALAVADLNLDGRPDLVTADETGGTVSVRLNTTAPGAASASFATAITYAAGTTPSAVVLRDLDGDGRPEILVTNAAARTVRVLRNDTTPGAASPAFSFVGDFAAGDSPAGLAVADLNGDGQRDLVVANAGAGTLSVLLNTLFTVDLSAAVGIGTILDDDTDTVPDAFSFPTQTGVAAATVVVSAPVTVSGINARAAIRVANGEYSLDGGAYTAADGAVANGQSVRVRHVAAATPLADTVSTLTIGGVGASFTSTTAEAPSRRAGGAWGPLQLLTLLAASLARGLRRRETGVRGA